MSVPARPRALNEGPSSSCVIHGKALGWTNCTPASFAMGVHKATLGAKHPSPCDVRRNTGDTDGGTTIPQCARAIDNEYGVATDVYVGNAAASPTKIASALHAGRGVALQGNCSALIRTDFRSTGGAVNHCVYLNEGRGWAKDAAGNWVPKEVLVYDPAADGRRSGWGTADTQPSWWPWSLAKKFAAALRPWGDNDSRLLGPGRMYSAIFPDTEPHMHRRYSSERTVPFPDRMVINVPSGRKANVRTRPDRLVAGDIVARLADNTPWVAYQKARGAKPAGSKSDVWYGDHDGTRWVHISNLASIGGAS